jgi:hypothetical protein
MGKRNRSPEEIEHRDPGIIAGTVTYLRRTLFVFDRKVIISYN